MLTVEHISKSYGQQKVLDDLSFSVAKGEILAVLGPSGSGKSTLLKVIAGLEKADEGRVLWNGEKLADVAAHERGFGYMFQDYALFPHRDVAGNVAFGLEMMGQVEGQIRERVVEMLKLVGLDGLEKRDIGELSGGEQQRVALARALAPLPQLLMLDEPLGSLDRALREELGGELSRILRESRQTSIYVTHDQEEAYAIADRIVLLNGGRIAQIGSPQELYFAPASKFVAKFLGLENIFSAVIRDKGKRKIAETVLGEFPVPNVSAPGEAVLLIRPDRIQVGKRSAVKIQGKLRKISFRGRYSELEVESEGEILRVQVPGEASAHELGEDIWLSFNPKDSIQVLDDD